MRPKSKEIKEMQGTYEPSKEGEDTIKYPNYEINPPAPVGWPPRIQKVWSDRCSDLKKSGYLVKAFMPLLRRYCFAILQAEEAEGKLLTDGFIEYKNNIDGIPYEAVSKWLAILDNANKTIERIGAKFGFSPLDVQKIPAINKPDGKEMSLLK